jgi:exonuclease III
MNQPLRIALWNANGLVNHNQEVKLFISTHKLDIMLISETHFTDLNWFKIPNFTVYCTNHPDNTAHGGSAILIKNTIKHFILPNYQYDHIQGTILV